MSDPKGPAGEKRKRDEDEKVAPPQKTKKTESSTDYVQIGERKHKGTVRVTVSDLSKVGMRVDIREYYNLNGEQKPGKKGINLSVWEWEALKKKVAKIDALIAKAKEKEEEYRKYRMSIID